MNLELQQEMSSLDDNWLVRIRTVQVSPVQREGSSEVLQINDNTFKTSHLSLLKGAFVLQLYIVTITVSKSDRAGIAIFVVVKWGWNTNQILDTCGISYHV